MAPAPSRSSRAAAGPIRVRSLGCHARWLSTRRARSALAGPFSPTPPVGLPSREPVTALSGIERAALHQRSSASMRENRGDSVRSASSATASQNARDSSGPSVPRTWIAPCARLLADVSTTTRGLFSPSPGKHDASASSTAAPHVLGERSSTRATVPASRFASPSAAAYGSVAAVPEICAHSSRIASSVGPRPTLTTARPAPRARRAAWAATASSTAAGPCTNTRPEASGRRKIASSAPKPRPSWVRADAPDARLSVGAGVPAETGGEVRTPKDKVSRD